MVVVGITFNALFATMAWGVRMYASNRQGKESRELVFSWIQTFESLWPGAYDNVGEAIEAASKILGGTWNSDGKNARIGGYTLTVVSWDKKGDERLELRVTVGVSDSNKTLLDLTRNYNAFSNETVSDDTVS
jgi:hypothetical protein